MASITVTLHYTYTNPVLGFRLMPYYYTHVTYVWCFDLMHMFSCAGWKGLPAEDSQVLESQWGNQKIFTFRSGTQCYCIISMFVCYICTSHTNSCTHTHIHMYVCTYMHTHIHSCTHSYDSVVVIVIVWDTCQGVGLWLGWQGEKGLGISRQVAIWWAV